MSTPPGTRLLTLLHISDLHFGVPPASAGARPPIYWRHLELFDGWLGHNEWALKHLEDFWRRLQPENPVLVVTGDFTACGKLPEFLLSTRYLRSAIQTANRVTGLGVADILARSIPGNHDYWPGSHQIVGGPTVGLSTTFRARPIKAVSLPLATGQRLVLMGIDSDADAWPTGPTRLLGRGAFVSQIDTLEPVVGPPGRDEIRVLMVHHSPMYDERWALKVVKRSRRALWAFVKRAGISVMLTGHIHVPLGAITRVSHRGTGWPVFEARCGTTTQVDEIPVRWVAAGTNEAGQVDEQAAGRAAAGTDEVKRMPLNSLLVHRLYHTGRTIEWRTDRIDRVHTGFDADHAVPLIEAPLKVWPH